MEWHTGNTNVKEEEEIPIASATASNKQYVDCIKRFLIVGERYVIEIPSQCIDVPVFFYIKEIKDDKVMIYYVKIKFLKHGTGKGSITPKWNEIKERLSLDNDIISFIQPFDEDKEYLYEAYFVIKPYVESFYTSKK